MEDTRTSPACWRSERRLKPLSQTWIGKSGSAVWIETADPSVYIRGTVMSPSSVSSFAHSTRCQSNPRKPDISLIGRAAFSRARSGTGRAVRVSAASIASNSAATDNTNTSPPRGPTICKPNGMPCLSRPTGSDTAGCPGNVTAYQRQPMEVGTGRPAVNFGGIQFAPRPWADGDRRCQDHVLCRLRARSRRQCEIHAWCRACRHSRDADL
jgi:hypothetical protein